MRAINPKFFWLAEIHGSSGFASYKYLNGSPKYKTDGVQTYFAMKDVLKKEHAPESKISNPPSCICFAHMRECASREFAIHVISRFDWVFPS
jgi:hypothetical protein